MSSILQKIGFIKNDFEDTFFFNEYKSLKGRHSRTSWVLGSILLLTFLALGFAIGSIQKLEKKMNNPFTNWLEVDVGGKAAKQADYIFDRYEDSTQQAHFLLNDVIGFKGFVLHFHPHADSLTPYSNENTITSWGRTLHPDDTLLLQKILNQEERPVPWIAQDFIDKGMKLEDCEIIISSFILEKLDYKDFDQVKYIMIHDGVYDLPILLKVAAVVDELPGKNRFLCSQKLYNIISGKKCQALIKRNKLGKTPFYLMVHQSYDEQVLESRANTFWGGLEPTFSAEETFDSGKNKWQKLTLSFSGKSPSLDSIQAFLVSIRSEVPISEYASIECGGYLPSTLCDELPSRKFHEFAFYFNRLDSVRAFKDDFFDRFEVEIDTKQIAAKENFALVSRLTLFTALTLVAFSIFCIILFVNNLLRTHLYEMKSNLGTFKAFGLDNRFLIRIYLKIIFSFLVIAIIPSFLICLGIDLIEESIQGSGSVFDILNSWVAFVIIGLIVSSLLLAAFIIQKILGDTPGNLVYKR